MPTQDDAQLVDVLRALDDDALFSFDDELAAGLERQVLRMELQGIRIRAPEHLDVRTQTQLPVLLLSKCTGLRDWQVNPRRNAVLVGVDGGTGTVRAGWAFPTHKRINTERMQRSLEQADEPGPEDAASVMVSAQLLTGREALDLPWTAGEHSLTLIRYDWRSNTVRVRLVDRIEAQAAGYPAENARKLVSNEVPARFQRDEHTPSVEGTGAALSAPSRAEARASGFVVRGVMRLLIPAGCIVAHDEMDGARLPGAVLRGAILLIKRDELSPVQVEVEIPIFTRGKVMPGDEVEGCFTLDLYALGLREQLLRGDTLLYLVAGDHVSAPSSVEVRP